MFAVVISCYVVDLPSANVSSLDPRKDGIQYKIVKALQIDAGPFVVSEDHGQKASKKSTIPVARKTPELILNLSNITLV